MKQFNIKKKLKKAVVALILSALLATIPLKVKASNDDDLGCSYERMGEPEFLDELYDILNNIEPGFKAYFEANNLRVIIMEGEYSAEAMYENNIESIDFAITGFADNDLNTIYVESVIREDYYDKYPESSKGLSLEEFSYRISRDTLLHELGHFIDGITDFDYSSTDLFQSIYVKEVDNFTKTTEYNVDNLGIRNNIRNSSEYFATAFSCYVSYPDSLLKYCPDTYNYFKMLEKDLRVEYNVEEDTSYNESDDMNQINNNQELNEAETKAEADLVLNSLLSTSPTKIETSGDDYLGCSYEKVGNPKYLDSLYYVLKNIDSGFKAFFEDFNLRVIIMEGKNSADAVSKNNGEAVNSSISGYLASDINTIFVEGVSRDDYYNKYPDSSKGLSKEEFSYRLSRDTLLHELGHFLDGINSGCYSNSNLFQSIYDEEKDNFTKTTEFNVDNLKVMNNISDSSDYFASAFSCYVAYPNNLAHYCPKTYGFFSELSKNFREFYNIEQDNQHKKR